MLFIRVVNRYLIGFQPNFITRNNKKSELVFAAGFGYKINSFKVKNNVKFVFSK